MGKKSAEMEIKSAKDICEQLNIRHRIIDLPWLGQILNSALTSDEEVPELEIKSQNPR